MSTIVNYVKHWDNNTSGSIEFAESNKGWATEQTAVQLISDAIDDGIDVNVVSPAELFTITSVKVGDRPLQAWNGVPKAAF